MSHVARRAPVTHYFFQWLHSSLDTSVFTVIAGRQHDLIFSAISILIQTITQVAASWPTCTTFWKIKELCHKEQATLLDYNGSPRSLTWCSAMRAFTPSISWGRTSLSFSLSVASAHCSQDKRASNNSWLAISAAKAPANLCWCCFAHASTLKGKAP